MFSKSCKYAIRAVLYMAIQEPNQMLRVDDISKQLGVPKHFLAKILQQLVKYNLVSSTKGRNGGFFLSEENRNSTLINVIDAIEGPGVFGQCLLGLPECSDQSPCPYHNTYREFRNRFFSILSKESISESAERILDNNLKLKVI